MKQDFTRNAFFFSEIVAFFDTKDRFLEYDVIERTNRRAFYDYIPPAANTGGFI